MGLSGKYNFIGIKKQGAAGLRLAFATTPCTAWITKLPALSNLILEFISNWLANKGLIVMNVGAIYYNGYLDQHNFDKGMDEALAKIQAAGGVTNLTPEQMKAIDDEVIKVFDKFAIIGNGKPKS